MNAHLRIDGETLVFPIIGHPIGQVKSPASLSQIMAERGYNGMVVPVHVLPQDLDGWLQHAAAVQNCRGIVVTVPHKVASMQICSRVTARAQTSGAVNILLRDETGWVGDATDGQGFMDGVNAQNFDVAGKPALLVGGGGAGSAIAYEILARGASELALHDIDAGRRDGLIARLNAIFPGRVRVGSDDPRGFALVANATPLGMRETDPLPVQVDLLEPGQFVADVVTRPAVPPLMAAARAKGCGTMPGSAMFEAQAVLLAELLMGVRKAALD
ncbi:shikimate dehydrogenase family protein [Paracoccus shanxieyensis]|uniref:Shikimate dehydrogenase n=1 Tax=Paracoccus shanxieyensis TaxID=2675752 RepID=A0A6L6IUF5_9RHOB|nr:shikimate dehydrogenase [Paracoccus shanxieyensis]MTH64116.1 shikimate dehydrogenase [Paracoccus shanxieyensis]MTH86843.1 shikimate dehydrogenase [Paracoccus shanxieyensis]